VFGGHGFIREHGMEQYVRDCRIAQIYEGTNGIQALDLVGRKLPANAGRNLRRFFHPVSAFIEANVEDGRLGEFVQPLAKAFVRLQQATAQVARAGMANPDEAGAAATDYLRLFGLTALGYLWARMAELSLARLDDDPDGFHRAKVATARFYVERILPQTNALFAAVMAGGASMMAFDEAAF
jgi:butyryl-CoA dehydrogenase